MSWGNQIIRISTGRLNTVNDNLIGGVSGGAAGFSKYAGMLGKTVEFDTSQIANMFDSAIGTLFMGRYRYVRMRGADDDSPVTAVGQILFWDTVVASWESAYQVTRDSNLSSSAESVLIAGIYIGGFDTDNYGFIQDLGEATVQFRGTLTAAGAIGSSCYAGGVGAGVDEGLADVLTTDSTAVANSRQLGIAVTAPSNGGTAKVLLDFHNALAVI